MKAIFERAKILLEGEDAYLCLCIPYQTAKKFLGEMKRVKYSVEIKQHRKKRSLDANAYAWELLGKLAPAVSTCETVFTPEELYREAIQDIGGNYEIMPVRNEALGRWVRIWESRGLGWVCEVMGPSKFQGYTNTRCFYGSSVYDTAQMSRLIARIVEECKAAGVETMTPEELARLVEEGQT